MAIPNYARNNRPLAAGADAPARDKKDRTPTSIVWVKEQ
jgi:hypothetical protein